MESSRFCSTWKFLILVIANAQLASSTGPFSMRCYCNLPECVERGEDSCRSRTGCFQELPHYNAPYDVHRRSEGLAALDQAQDVGLRYGCLELWPSDSASFQCTEPGIRKSPLDNVGRRSYDLSGSGELSHIKNDDRSAVVRRRPSNRHQNKVESRRWNAYDVPLRCCFGTLCNRRRVVVKQIEPSTTPAVTAATPDQSSLLRSPVENSASHPWWFTSTVVFVSIIGGITFVLLVVVGCWVLHSQNGGACRAGDVSKDKFAVRRAAVSIPARYCFHDGVGATDALESSGLLKTFNCVFVETADLPTTATGRCALHIPIVFSKYGDRVVNAKPAPPDTRTLVP